MRLDECATVWKTKGHRKMVIVMNENGAILALPIEDYLRRYKMSPRFFLFFINLQNKIQKWDYPDFYSIFLQFMCDGSRPAI